MDKTYFLDIAEAALNNAKFRHILSNHFKIGKTTQSLEERFVQNYQGKYEDIVLLYDAGTDGSLVDWLEEEMIKHCWDVYGRKECDNDQIGGGPSCTDNATTDNTAKLYVVFR